MSPVQFLQLSQTQWEQVFRKKVVLQDVEEKAEDSSSSSQLVSRSLVLPLPRSFSEAAKWDQRAKKSSRVYAMYPQTTSLYSAMVVDNMTYCRQDDDIIVVEFDGDEPDAVTGLIPQCHIPAHFVTLIPREFPTSQANNNSNSSMTTTFPWAWGKTASYPSAWQAGKVDLMPLVARQLLLSDWVARQGLKTAG